MWFCVVVVNYWVIILVGLVRCWFFDEYFWVFEKEKDRGGENLLWDSFLLMFLIGVFVGVVFEFLFKLI